MVADHPELGSKLIIRHTDKRFKRRQARVTKRLKLVNAIKMDDELSDGDADGELHGNQLLVAKRIAAAQPSCAV